MTLLQNRRIPCVNAFNLLICLLIKYFGTTLKISEILSW
jgi:hypothetical protein